MPVTEFHPLRLAAREPLAEDAVLLRLALPAQLRETFAGRAGQHVVVRLDVNGAEQRRTYSLLSAPGAAALELGVRIHADGLVSKALATLPVGTLMDTLPPAGGFVASEDAADVKTALLLAAGCGITPILAIANNLLERTPGTHCVIVFGNRSSKRTMCVEQLSDLKDRYLSRLSLQFVMSREPQDLDLANGRIDPDWLQRAAGQLFDPAALDGVWVCGPGAMNEDIAGALATLGTAPERIHSERFSVDADAVHAPTQASQPTAGTDAATGIQVTVVMDGRKRTFVASADDTLLQAGLEAGLDLPYSCCGGVCSTCRVRVTDGAADMDVNYALEDWETELGFVLACQARPQGRAITISYDQR